MIAPAPARAQSNSVIIIHNAPIPDYDSLDLHFGSSGEYILFPFGPLAYRGGIGFGCDGCGHQAVPFALSIFGDPMLFQYSEIPDFGWAAFLSEELPGDTDPDPLDVVLMNLFPRSFSSDSIGVLFVNGSPDMPEVDLWDVSADTMLARGVAYQTGQFFTIAPVADDYSLMQLAITVHDDVQAWRGSFAFEIAPWKAGQSWVLSTSGYFQPPQSSTYPLGMLSSNLGFVETIDISQSTAREHEESPTTFLLPPAYPNPFNPSTQFMLRVDQPQDVRLSVHDVWGREVRRIHEGVLMTGTHPFTFNADGLPSGTYLIRAQGQHASQAQLVTLVK